MNDGTVPTEHRAVLTGASSYIGAALLRHLKAQGCRVTVLGRRRPVGLDSRDDFVEWNIGDPVPDTVFEGADRVFHLAHDWRADAGPAENSPNFKALRSLRDAARSRNVKRFLYAGSQSAGAAEPTRYGAVKRAGEELLDADGEISVRIGLVCGGAWGGPMRQLLNLLRRAAVVPSPAGPPAVQPVHVDDVAAALIALADKGWAGDRPPSLVGPDLLDFADFVRALAAARFGRRLRVLRVPRSLLRALAGMLGGSFRERVAGLAAMEAMTRAVPEDCTFRSFEETLAPERRRRDRRDLVREGRALLDRMTAGTPPPGLVRRYARTLNDERLGALGLPRSRLACGFALRWRERARREAAVRDRLGFALALIEAHPDAQQLLSERRRGTGLSLRAAAGMAADLAFGVAGKAIR